MDNIGIRREDMEEAKRPSSVKPVEGEKNLTRFRFSCDTVEGRNKFFK